MAFMQAYGVKGAECYSNSGDARLDLFTRLVRGATMFDDMFMKSFLDFPQDTCVLAFQTRDIRGGKGERELFRVMMRLILKRCPDLSEKLLRLVPEYGRWDDIWALYGISPEVSSTIDRIVLEQFQLDQESEVPSLLAKWLPREHSVRYSTKDMAKHFANLFFPLTPMEKGYRAARYRKTVSFLNKKIDTTEIKMCGNKWSSIVPSRVPGQLLKRNKDAFFNKIALRLRGRISERSDLPDRIACAEHFRSYIAQGKVKGAQTTMPHEHIHEVLKGFYNIDSDSVIQAQWNAIREETLKGGGLGRAVFLCDFSGSMDGVPKEVSLALGILGSEVTSPEFRNHILTFDSSPQWHRFPEHATLREKVESVGQLGTGTSTNFQAACNLILERLIIQKVSPDNAPTHLITVTDMGFDAACGENNMYVQRGDVSWQTQFQMVRESFAKHGYEPPLIVCWNVSAKYTDAHATANEVGVVQLSGWSPSLLKAFQTGITVQTPYEGLRALLDSPRYDRVREAFTPTPT